MMLRKDMQVAPRVSSVELEPRAAFAGPAPRVAQTGPAPRAALATGAKLLVLLAICLALSALACVAPEKAHAVRYNPQSGTYVFDEAGLFSPSEFEALESQAAELANKYSMGVYFHTTNYMNGLSSPSSSQRTSYATTYYKDHNLGLNPTDKSYGDGIMFVVASESRDYVTIAYGQGSYSFSDKGIDAMEKDVTDKLGDNDWYGAAQAYYKDIGGQLAYYDSHGKAQVPLTLTDWLIRLAIIVLLPLIITRIIIRSWRSEMLTAVEQSEAGNYLERESVVVTRANDQFVRTSLVATPKPKNESGGGGGWGGGGGGGFSSSGGGKF